MVKLVCAVIAIAAVVVPVSLSQLDPSAFGEKSADSGRSNPKDIPSPLDRLWDETPDRESASGADPQLPHDKDPVVAENNANPGFGLPAAVSLESPGNPVPYTPSFSAQTNNSVTGAQFGPAASGSDNPPPVRSFAARPAWSLSSEQEPSNHQPGPESGAAAPSNRASNFQSPANPESQPLLPSRSFSFASANQSTPAFGQPQARNASHDPAGSPGYHVGQQPGSGLQAQPVSMNPQTPVAAPDPSRFQLLPAGGTMDQGSDTGETNHTFAAGSDALERGRQQEPTPYNPGTFQAQQVPQAPVGEADRWGNTTRPTDSSFGSSVVHDRAVNPAGYYQDPVNPATGGNPAASSQPFSSPAGQTSSGNFGAPSAGSERPFQPAVRPAEEPSTERDFSQSGLNAANPVKREVPADTADWISQWMSDAERQLQTQPVPGMPLTLEEAVYQTRPENRRAMLPAYWQVWRDLHLLRESLADQQFLQSLQSAGRNPDPTGLENARQAVETAVLQRTLTLQQSQEALRQFFPNLAVSEYHPLPADRPVTGQYATHYEWYVANNQGQPQLELLSEALPGIHQNLQQLAHETRTAQSALQQSVQQALNGQAILPQMQQAMQTRDTALAGWLESVRLYNATIGNYALTLKQDLSEPQEVVRMLIPVRRMTSALASTDTARDLLTAQATNGLQGNAGQYAGFPQQGSNRPDPSGFSGNADGNRDGMAGNPSDLRTASSGHDPAGWGNPSGNLQNSAASQNGAPQQPFQPQNPQPAGTGGGNFAPPQTGAPHPQGGFPPNPGGNPAAGENGTSGSFQPSPRSFAPPPQPMQGSGVQPSGNGS